jgi:hypothetical protein
MALNASSFRQATTNILASVGSDVTMRQVTFGAYNPVKGQRSQTTVDTVVKGFVEGVKTTKPDPQTVITKKLLTIAAASISFTPSTTDLVVIGGLVHKIESVETTEVSGMAVSHQLKLVE